MSNEPGPGDDLDEQARWDMIHRFLDGLSSLPERRIVERWAADDIALQRYLRAHRQVWSLVARRPGDEELRPEDAWEHLQDRIAEHDRRGRFGAPGRGLEHLRVLDGGRQDIPARRSVLLSRTAIAAASFIIIGASAWAISREVEIVRAHPVDGALVASRPAATAVTFASRRGERRTVRLPDGTDVVIAPETELSYTEERGGAVHAVSLVGEASFHVEHRTDREFLVRAPGFETRDLGTTFDVRAYPSTTPRVSVDSGEVSVQPVPGAGAATTIPRGFVAVVDVARGATVVRPLTGPYAQWLVGRLEFKDATVREVAADIGRWYDLDMTIADSTLSARTVTITIDGGTARDVLKSLQVTLATIFHDVRITQRGREVRLFRE